MATVTSTEPNDNRSQANPFVVGDTITGSVSSKDDWDFHKFTVTEAKVVRLDIRAAKVNDWAYMVRVFDDAGNILSGTFLGMEDSASFTFAAPAAGSYYVAVTSSSTFSTSPYTITTSYVSRSASDYESVNNDSLATAGAMSLDRVVTGQRSGSGDIDYFVVTADAAGTLVVDFRAPETYSSDAYKVSIFDAAGNLVDARSAGGSMTFAEKVAGPGKYYIRVEAADRGPYEGGDYQLVAHVAADAVRTAAPALASGASVIGSIATATEHDWYKVELQAGSLAQFSAAGATGGGGTLAAPSLAILSADGRLLYSATRLATYESNATAHTADPQLAFVAPYTGTYYVMVDGLGDTGTYRIEHKSATVASLLPGLLHDASGGAYVRWASTGGTTTVRYGFMTDSTQAMADGEASFIAMSDAEKQTVRDVLKMFSAVANIDFIETAAGSAQMLFGTSDQSGVSAGVAYTDWASGGLLNNANVYMSHKSSSGKAPTQTMQPGGYGYETLIHEIGHALGLKHPGNYNAGASGGDPPFLPGVWDNGKYTLMSYIENPAVTVGALTPAMLDIAALQLLYGVRTSTTARTLTFSATEEQVQAILYGDNTLDLSAQTVRAMVSTLPGTFSSIGVTKDGTPAQDNVYLATSARVSAVIGTALNDVVFGNATGLAVSLGAGDDVFYGGAGNDAVTGGAGNDTVDGGAGTDSVIYTGNRAEFRVMKTASGWQAGAKAVSGNTDTLANVEKLVFADGTINLDYNDAVQQLYVAYFGRPADSGALVNFAAMLRDYQAPTGIQGLNDAYQTNANVRALIDTFGTSQESKDLYGSGTTRDFVTAIYNYVLNRSPDTEGLNWWVDAIDRAGLTKGNAALSIMAGALANTTPQGLVDRAVVTNKIIVASNFTFAIDTNAEVAGYSGNAAAAAARSMLSAVNGSTSTLAYQATVESTLAALSGSGRPEQESDAVPALPADAGVVVIGIATADVAWWNVALAA